MASKREALIASAEKSLQKGKVDLALRDYLKVLDETPNDINILNKIGDLQVRLGKPEESIPFFLRIAEHYAHDGFYVRAIAMYKKVNKLDPARLDIYEKLAELYVKQQLWMEAKSNYQVLADYLLKQENLPGAIAIYEKMVAIEPQNLQLHVKLADLFTQAKRIPEALREYAVVASALSERGAHEESIRVYEKALKLAPDNVEILRTLVPLLLSLNQVEQARAALRKGLEASPRSVPLFLLAAEAALAANDMAEARSYSDKARAVEPENEDVLAAAVKIQLKGRRPDLAWNAALPLADAAVRRGEAKKALALLVPIARSAPDNDDLVKKVVDVASGVGDETTALPFRSALAELYRKKGRLAEAADLLRHCARIQPDNAEFRARLAQLEPAAGAATVAPPRVPPPSLERKLEVTLSGFGQPSRAAAPPAAPPAAEPEPVPEPAQAAAEFEFDLDEVEAVDEAAEPAAAPSPAPEAPATPPRGLSVPSTRPAREPAWTPLTAAEALEAFEAREAESARSAVPSGFGVEEIEELRPEAELPQAAPASQAPSFADLDLALAPPDGFGQGLELGDGSFPVPAGPAVPEPEWSLPRASGPVSFPGDEIGGPPSFGPASRPASGDAALDDALVEADVFRRYGLLEKAVEQLRPWLEKAPENLKVRERLFELHLEQGHRDEARSHGTVLAEAYSATGRDDRVKALEALLGEPLRPAVPEPAPEAPGLPRLEPEPEPAPSPDAPGLPAPGPVPEPWEAVPTLAAGEEALGLELPAVEVGTSLPVDLPSVTIPEEPAAEGLGAEFEFVTTGAEPLSPLPDSSSATFDEPLTEIISAGMAAPAPAGSLEPLVAEPPAETFPPEPEAEPEPAPAPAPPSSPEPAPLVAPPEAAPVVLSPAQERAVPERRPVAKEKLSAADLLGLGKPAPAAKKPKAVRPEDLELDLLGGKPAKGKGKPKPGRPEPVLPDDLLKSLEKPRSPRAVEPAPAVPAASEPVPAAPVATEPAVEVSPVPVGPDGFPGDAFAEASAAEPVPPTEPFELPAPPPEAPVRPVPEELAELDFCLDQGMVVDAAERLQSLEARFPGDPDLATRRLRLEGGRGGAEAPRTALQDILSDDLDSVLDAELGRALTEDMVRESPAAVVPAPPPAEAAAGPVLDDSGLFSDEQEFFNFADELHTELRKESELPPSEEGREVSLEEIFRDFKKGVEQQLSPEDYETHYNLGIAYKEMGLTDEAIGEFQLASKDPLHAVECCAMLGLCFLEKGLPQLSVKWYRKGLETIGIKESDRLGLQYALAGILEQIGDREGAYRTYLDIYGTNAQFEDVADRIKALKPVVEG